jgi:hypothetical protein
MEEKDIQQRALLHSKKLLIEGKKVRDMSVNMMQRTVLTLVFHIEFFNWKEIKEERARIGELDIYEDYINVGQGCTNHGG